MRQLNKTVVVGGVVYPAGTAATPEIEGKVTNPAHWDGEPEAAADVPDDTGYSSWSKAALEDELNNRNEGRDNPIEVPGRGNKPDLIKALEDDDKSS